MGQYHYLVNLSKQQFIHPHRIGNGFKLYEQFGWRYSTATALVMLLAASNKGGERGGGDFSARHPLIGSWAGDRIAFIGDYSKPDDIPNYNAKRIYQECKLACSLSETPGARKCRKRWTHISSRVREMMSAEFSIRYVGDGWLDIVTNKGGKVEHPIAPDFVITTKG
ncbi:MAG: hypothetical protein KGL39_33265 [Patescibacteria group bacterium]|nr:hypothetical protein [Patescibacteria group bacterium]